MRFVLPVLLASCAHWGGPGTCAVDGDCALDERCHPEGGYCELDQRDVVIGVLTPVEGTIPDVEARIDEALTIAQYALDSAGGLLGGRRVRFALASDRPAEDVPAIAEALLDAEPIPVLVGPRYSSAALAVADILEERRIPAMVTANSPEVDALWPGCDRWMFTDAEPSSVSGVLGGRFLASRGCQNVAVLEYDSASGLGFADGVRLALDDAGVAYRTIPLSRDLLDDYQPLVAEIAAGSDCGFVHGSIRVSGALMADWSQAPPPDWTWVGTWSEESFADSPIPGLYDGTFTLASSREVHMANRAVEVDDLLDLYEQAIGPWPTENGVREAPSTALTGTFDLAIMAALAVDLAGTTHRGTTAHRDAIWKLSEGTNAFGPTAIEAIIQREWDEGFMHYSGAYSRMRFSNVGRTRDWSNTVQRIENDTIAVDWEDDPAEVDRLISQMGIADRTPSACSGAPITP